MIDIDAQYQIKLWVKLYKCAELLLSYGVKLISQLNVLDHSKACFTKLSVKQRQRNTSTNTSITVSQTELYSVQDTMY